MLHAAFRKDGIDYHYKDAQTGQYKMIDGEPKAWDLEWCLKQRFANSADPVRVNVELFVALRNKVEHRYEHSLKIVTGGKAHALVMNYEQQTVAYFGPSYSLADQLRFPITLQSLTAEGFAQQKEAAAKLPKKTRDLVAKFEAGLDPAVKEDLRYDYRVQLVPIVGSKTDADLSLNFVKLDDLTEDERIVMNEAGRTGTVITKIKHVEVADKNLRATQVAALVTEQVPFEFTVHGDHTEMWRRIGIRPAPGAADPYATDSRYCVFSEAFNSYLYTSSWVKKIVREIGTVDKYRAFFGKDPRMKKVTQLPASGSRMPGNPPQSMSA
ncbi:DUF3644 domain-containing protein [Streptomyces sp. NPDC058405]|uniref:DUF3644 domain-containing protein n=2 Tax=unclassified Streptomyces TaxID=2593676 RepID=UPI003647ACDF